MYAIVLATAMTAGTAAPDLHFRGGCYGCYGGNAFSSCYGCYGCGGGCYGGCYGGCSGSCYGCYGGGSCYGGCGGSCYGSCSGGYTYFEAYGGFGGCGGCFGGCFGGCTGYYGGAMPTYFTPAPPIEKKKAGDELVRATTAPATVVVKAPLDSTVKVNGHITTRRSAEETFLTPALVSGKTYSYTFESAQEKDGQVVTTTKRVTVQAGGRTVVDLDAPAAEKASAKVTIVLPEGAKVFVNDIAYGGEAKQTFDTPKLTAGKRFYYTVRAESKRDGRAVSESRRVAVEAGKEVTVDFTTSSREVLTASR